MNQIFYSIVIVLDAAVVERAVIPVKPVSLTASTTALDVLSIMM